MAEVESDDEFLLDADELKKLGNDAFAAKSFMEAAAHYTSALAAEPAEPHVIYSNRSKFFFHDMPCVHCLKSLFSK